ncbi:hypothetical protein GW793_04300 [bacterium]|uniref:Uncharacterized protein n=2 Tax=Katanobacteria TaxID=422282 RepID=A0A2M7X394_UNCKA|nr:hypothetical protein [bacterium]PIP56232.1 MAG: hypothetical protein COX05_04145 [candidate division WWE3 bacterium CG22_combo_CG10-13_8_21_14_all_39_12]PJA40652.1 MAG: hypothetical protein CO179_01705 [candidate division WWE3 bacterium CG_4_9_14_3_um_filter_39_7]
MKKLIEYFLTIINYQDGSIASTSFFDYSSSKKKRIIETAGREANEQQLQLVKEYERKSLLQPHV